MATLTRNKTFPLNTDLSRQDFYDLIDQSGVSNVGQDNGDLAASLIESGLTVGGVTGTAAASAPALRKLGTGANDACAGNDARLADARTATALKHGSTVVNLGSTVPTAGQVLGYDGSNWNPQSAGAATWTAGNGTADSANSGADTVVTADTAGAFAALQVGWLVRLDGDDALVGRITSITDSSTIVLGGINLGTQNNVAWAFQIVARNRAWDSIRNISSVDSPVTLTASDTGLLVLVDTSGGNVEVNLPKCTTFGTNSVSIKKITDDTKAVTVKTASGDNIGADNAMTLAMRGSSITLVSDGLNNWATVIQYAVTSASAGSIVLQRIRLQSTAAANVATLLPAGGNIALAPVITDGTEILTSASYTSGTGTVSTATGDTVVTGSGTAFTTQLQVGWTIKVGTVAKRIVAIGSDTKLIVDSKWGANNATQAFTYTSSVLTITPTASNSKIRVRVLVNGGWWGGNATTVSLALFKTVSGVTTLVAATGRSIAWDNSHLLLQIPLDVDFTSGTTSPITFSLRLGGSTSGTFRLNLYGDNTGTAPYGGGNLSSFIEVSEESA